MQKQSQIQSGTREKITFTFCETSPESRRERVASPPKKTSNYFHIGRGKKCGKKVKIYIQTSSGHACSGSIATTTITIILVAMTKLENLIFFVEGNSFPRLNFTLLSSSHASLIIKFYQLCLPRYRCK